MNTIKETMTIDTIFLKSIKLINEVKIFNEIQNYKKLIIFDFRKREDFNINHIHNSINIPFNEFDFKFFETIDDQKLCYLCNNFVKCDELKCMLKRYKRYYIVLIMSQEKIKRKTIEAIGTGKKLNSEEEKDQIIKSLLLYKALQKNRVYEMGMFNLGFKKIIKHFDFLVCSETRKSIVK
jgi:hypothetical protein